MEESTVRKDNKMGVMPVNKLLLNMSIPMMISMLVQALYNVVDSMFVAQISEDALTAVSLAFPAQNLMISVAIGEKESEGIRKKPAPDTVREALKELGSVAESAVYVGDSDVDIETARNSGMDEILCDWGFRGEEFLKEHGAKIIIKKPEEILTIIGVK